MEKWHQTGQLLLHWVLDLLLERPQVAQLLAQALVRRNLQMG